MQETLYGSGLCLDHLSLFWPAHSLWKSLSHHFPSPSHCQLGAYHPWCLPTSPLNAYLPSQCLPPPSMPTSPSRHLPPLLMPTSTSAWHSTAAWLAMSQATSPFMPVKCVTHGTHKGEGGGGGGEEEGRREKGQWGDDSNDEIITTMVSRPLRNHQWCGTTQMMTVMSSLRLQWTADNNNDTTTTTTTTSSSYGPHHHHLLLILASSPPPPHTGRHVTILPSSLDFPSALFLFLLINKLYLI